MMHAESGQVVAAECGIDRPRLLPRLSARRVFLIAGVGAGKSTLIASAAAAEAAPLVLRCTAGHATPSALAALLEVARRSDATAVFIDDAEWCSGGEASDVLEQFVADAPMRVIIASREPLPFAMCRAEHGSTSILGPRDLAIRLDEVGAVFEAAGAACPPLSEASRILAETAGSPALVDALARAVTGVDREGLDSAISAVIAGGVLAPTLESMLADLQPATRAVLTTASALPIVRFGPLADLLGAVDRETVVGLLDDGVLPHRLRPDGGRELPRMLRRHLASRLSTADRRALVHRVAAVLPTTDAVRVLADAGHLDEVAAVQRRDPLTLARPGAASWEQNRALPGDEFADLLRVRALIDDREPDAARRRLEAVAARLDRDLAPVVAALREDLDALALPFGAGAAASGRSSSRTSEPNRTTLDPRGAAHRLLAGDAVTAVRMLTRRSQIDAPVGAHLSSRLVLAIARSGHTPPADTGAALCQIEAEASAHGLSGLARIARGLLAATSTDAPPRAVHEVIAECETRGDDEGAAFIEGAWFLSRARAGQGETRRALALAERLDRIGATEAATVAASAAAYLAAVHGDSRAGQLLNSAEADALVTPGPAARAWLDAARLITSGDTSRAARARSAALDAGMPRLPIDLHARSARFGATNGAHTSRASFRTDTAPILVDRIPRVTVGCFGGFRLTVDGRDLDLHGVRPQARNVLRMLALNAGSPVHRELIAEVIWGELGSTSAMHALHVSVSSLRRALGLDTADRIVARDGEAYQLRLADRRDCDLADFDANLDGAALARRNGDADGTADGLRRALGRYVGDVLPEDGPAEWAVGARDRYRMRACEAASALAHLELRSGDRDGALDAATRAIEIDPWHDASWRALLAVHRESGDVVATRRAEQGYRRMRVALGVD
ncbi:BTAD domain-containing putative transcriptional regulator [Agromyces sp. LHK192]|uniref:AfsR/SARP family transcriptional regulator n=1 Tax=Agromyces sp. LHK192 TaxID=2498704 RepID=UPI000FD7582F|nr:BTAD domain-containing putative transcriptional regulator [Agromyces sp. LHK192]